MENRWFARPLFAAALVLVGTNGAHAQDRAGLDLRVAGSFVEAFGGIGGGFDLAVAKVVDVAFLGAQHSLGLDLQFAATHANPWSPRSLTSLEIVWRATFPTPASGGGAYVQIGAGILNSTIPNPMVPLQSGYGTPGPADQVGSVSGPTLTTQVGAYRPLGKTVDFTIGGEADWQYLYSGDAWPILRVLVGIAVHQ